MFTLKVDLRDLGRLDGSHVGSKECRRLDDHSVLQSAGESGPPKKGKVEIMFQIIKIFKNKFEHSYMILYIGLCYMSFSLPVFN